MPEVIWFENPKCPMSMYCAKKMCTAHAANHGRGVYYPSIQSEVTDFGRYAIKCTSFEPSGAIENISKEEDDV